MLVLSATLIVIGVLEMGGLRFEGEVFVFVGLIGIVWVLATLIIGAYALVALSGRRRLIARSFRFAQQRPALVAIVLGLLLILVGQFGVAHGIPASDSGCATQLYDRTTVSYRCASVAEFQAAEKAFEVLASGVMAGVTAMFAAFSRMIENAARMPLAAVGTGSESPNTPA